MLTVVLCPDLPRQEKPAFIGQLNYEPNLLCLICYHHNVKPTPFAPDQAHHNRQMQMLPLPQTSPAPQGRRARVTIATHLMGSSLHICYCLVLEKAWQARQKMRTATPEWRSDRKKSLCMFNRDATMLLLCVSYTLVQVRNSQSLTGQLWQEFMPNLLNEHGLKAFSLELNYPKNSSGIPPESNPNYWQQVT